LRAPPEKLLDFFADLRWKVTLMTHRRPKLLRIAGMSLACLAFSALAGGHWAALQTIAWAQMLRDYSKSAPLSEALVKTFSGNYPCGMCTKIATERQKEQKTPAAVKLDKKAESFLLSVREALSEPLGRDYSFISSGELAPIERSEAPPVPVPIFS